MSYENGDIYNQNNYSDYINYKIISLLKLFNKNNESIMNIDHQKIKKIKNYMLQRLGLSREKLKTYHKSLKQYRYIDERAGSI